MFSASLLMLLAAPTQSPVAAIADPERKVAKSCRDMIMSSSRLGPVRICKTRAQWRRYDDCHRSVTRYCTPKKRLARTENTVQSGKLVCKYVKETGSRLQVNRVCASAREWELAEEETQKALRDRQAQNKYPGNQ